MGKYNSPLRYPGGKGKITPFVSHLLTQNGIKGTYIEPFAGGAGIAVNLLLSGQVHDIIINDLDDGVYSFWKTVVTEPDWLIKAIEKIPFDTQTGLEKIGTGRAYWFWYTIRTRYIRNRYHRTRDKALDFFLLNRMNVSGIIKGGPIGGRKQTGRYNISSRFNKQNLIQRITAISDMSSHITVINHEATTFLNKLSNEDYCDLNDCFVFADPPYYVQGRHLYNTFATNRIHELIAEQLLGQHDWKWILTYDEAPQINNLYPNDRVNKFEYEIMYSANKHGQSREYLFADPRLTMETFNNVTLN